MVQEDAQDGPLGERLACGLTTTSHHLGPSLWANNSGDVSVMSKLQCPQGPFEYSPLE